MKLTLENIKKLEEIYGIKFEYLIIEDLESKRTSKGMYGKYEVTFYTTYEESDYDEDCGTFYYKTECKECICSVNELDNEFKDFIGKKYNL